MEPSVILYNSLARALRGTCEVLRMLKKDITAESSHLCMLRPVPSKWLCLPKTREFLRRDVGCRALVTWPQYPAIFGPSDTARDSYMSKPARCSMRVQAHLDLHGLRMSSRARLHSANALYSQTWMHAFRISKHVRTQFAQAPQAPF